MPNLRLNLLFKQKTSLSPKKSGSRFLQLMKKLFDFIILIDDDHASNYFHKVVIEDSGLVERAEFFTSPLKALEYLKNATLDISNLIPDLIVLDINMPLMDGWEFLEAFKTLNLHKYPKVIMLSTTRNPKDILKSEGFPMVSGLYSKPLNADLLKQIAQQSEVNL